MEKSILMTIAKAIIIFLALVGFVQLVMGGIEFATGSNPMCGLWNL